MGSRENEERKEGNSWNESMAVGIDLGTSNSCVSAVVEGKPQVLLNAEGDTITPSVVAFTSEGEVLVGLPAKRQALTNPKNTFFSVKRFMGCRSNEVSEDMVKALPYDLDLSGSVVKVVCPAVDRSLTPEAISAHVLSKLAKDASAYLEKDVLKAVITVPAYFNDSQRQATRDAARIAGLEVIRLVNEPTASCLHFGFQKAGDEVVLVYDLGGGTFDVSILETGDGLFEVLATSGDSRLGGDDFDDVIVQCLVDEFKLQEGIDLSDESGGLERLLEAAERAKRDLSSLSVVSVNIPFVWMSPEGEGKHILLDLERQEFESRCSDLLERCTAPLSSVVESSGLSEGVESITQVVLVGGSTRMPMVKAMVKEATGKVPCQGVNPDHSVALGAAIQAHSLTNGEADSPLLLDVTPISLGVEVEGDRMAILVERNSPIPTRAVETFSNGGEGKRVGVHVLQGERELASANKSLGVFYLDGVDAARGKASIEVTFDVTVDGMLSVKARDKGTGIEETMKVEGASNLGEEEVKELIEDFERNAVQDSDTVRGNQVRVSFEIARDAVRQAISDEDPNVMSADISQAEPIIALIERDIALKRWADAENNVKKLQSMLT
jgi:molecular chaperone DnaK